jgi:hypothetical protein
MVGEQKNPSNMWKQMYTSIGNTAMFIIIKIEIIYQNLTISW